MLSDTCKVLANLQNLLKETNPHLCTLSNQLDTHAKEIQNLSDEIDTKRSKSVSNLKRNSDIKDLVTSMQRLNSLKETTIPVTLEFIELIQDGIAKLTRKIQANESALSQKGYNKAGWNLVKGEIQKTMAPLIKNKNALTTIEKNYQEGVDQFTNDIINDEKYITMLQSLSTVTNGIRAGNYASGLPENLKATFPPIPGTGGKRTRRRRSNKKRTRRSC